MNKVYLVFDNGQRYQLATTPYHVWMETESYEGASDIAYEKWLKDNNLHDLVDFDLIGEYYWIEVEE